MNPYSNVTTLLSVEAENATAVFRLSESLINNNEKKKQKKRKNEDEEARFSYSDAICFRYFLFSSGIFFSHPHFSIQRQSHTAKK